MMKYINILTIIINKGFFCYEKITFHCALQPTEFDMDTDLHRKKLEGCYVTVPTPFKDDDEFTINQAALRTHIKFLPRRWFGRRQGTFWRAAPPVIFQP